MLLVEQKTLQITNKVTENHENHVLLSNSFDLVL